MKRYEVRIRCQMYDPVSGVTMQHLSFDIMEVCECGNKKPVRQVSYATSKSAHPEEWAEALPKIAEHLRKQIDELKIISLSCSS